MMTSEELNRVALAAARMTVESKVRVRQLAEAGGCEASSERSFHEGRLAALDALDLARLAT